MSEADEQPSRPARRLLIDLTPLRRSRDLRHLVSGELVSVLGTQLTTVAVPYQVYQLTHSSLDVGLVSITQLFPLIAGSLLAGSIVDAMDRRRLLMVAQVLMAACSAGLAVNTDLGTSLWPLFVLPALAAGFSGLDSAGRNAIVPNMVRRSEVSTANAIFQTLFQLGQVAGPALAGLLLEGAGVRFVYWLDVASFGAALAAVFLISPQPAGEPGHRPGLRSILEGLSFVRGRQSIQGAYLIDINAMVFGMPRALFPALATTVFGGGASTLGFLYAAPGAGALVGALTTGWVSRIQRQGLAVIVAVIAWGAAITCFGLVHWLPAALAAARRRGLRRRHLGGVPQHDHPAHRAGRTAGTPGGPADRRGHRRSPHRGPGVRGGGGRLRRHRIGRIRRPGLHRGRPGAGPRAARFPPAANGPGSSRPGGVSRRRAAWPRPKASRWPRPMTASTDQARSSRPAALAGPGHGRHEKARADPGFNISYMIGYTGWRWRESNPRPSVPHQGFSGRSLLCFSQPRRSRKQVADGLSHC